MTASPAWSPAPRPGIVPLHPLSFGALLGGSFSALRHNPRVLLGFAVGVQALAFLVVAGGTAAAAFTSFSRLDTLRPGTEEWEAVLAGSGLLTGLAGLVLGLLAAALQVIVQGVVIAQVSRAVVAERLSTRQLWALVRPAAWRLIGYSALVLAASLAGLLVLALPVVLLAASGVAVAAVLLGILLVLALIPLLLWLTTKLLLVPSVLVIEHATIPQAISRSWRLLRGRFWPALGVTVVILLVFNIVAQFVSAPAGLLISAVGGVLAPTSDPGTVLALTVTVSVAMYLLLFLMQAINLVVSSTASALIYVDCRMRAEGLDVRLLGYLERRDAGATDPGDPWAPGGAAPWPASASPYRPGPAPVPWPSATPPAGPVVPPPPPGGSAPPSSTSWAPPSSDGADRDSPWA